MHGTLVANVVVICCATYMMQQYLVMRADFYNWNRVKIRYCDGSSFTGDVEAVETVSLELGGLCDQICRKSLY